jgi:type I restriction enzyme, R subunit
MGRTGAFLDEAQTRSQLIDPALHARGWTEDLIRREETDGTVEIIEGRPRKSKVRRTDYTLRVKVAGGAQPVPSLPRFVETARIP